MTRGKSRPRRSGELADLRARLAEAEETLRAIRCGEADALVIAGGQGEEVHLLSGGDRIYRQFIEAIREGSATLSAGGEILSCDAALAKTLRRPLDQILGTAMRDHLPPGDQEVLSAALAEVGPESFRGKIHLKTSEGALVPVCLAATLLHAAGAEPVRCLVFTDLGEVISAEEALRKEKDRVQTYLNTVETIIVALDSQGWITSVNRKCGEILGWSEEELLGRNWFATCLPQPEGMENVYPYFLRLMCGEQEATEYFENPVVTRSGELRQIAWHNALLRDDRGSITGVLSSGEDITERKRAEDALRASRQLIEGIINAIPVRVFWKDRNLTYLGCNAAFARDAGFADPNDIIGKDDFQMGWKDEAELYRNDDRQVIESGDSKILIEEPQTTPEGKTITHLTSKLPLRDATGEINGVLGTYIDITERKREEADRLRLTVAIEQVGEPVMITDARGRIQYVNPVFEAVTGYCREELLGRSSRLLHGSQDDAAHFREVLETIRSGRVWRGRLVNRRKDGSLFTVETTLSPVRDAAGRIVNYVGVERDITEQLRLAEEKAGLEDQLRQAQKVEAIGRLAGGVAHDFNNLTAIVLGYGEMLLGQLRPDEPTRKWVEQIVAAGRRSALLTRQLLAFSRRQVLLPVVLDVNELLRNLERMLGRLIGEDIAMTLKLAGDLGRVTADPGQIEQVVTNLVINARDAMPDGGRLVVETANVELDERFAADHKGVVPGEYVRIAVADTGCGMDEATRARLFEPFFTTKPMGKGTGLGLATSFGIVKQTGGYLYVDSVHGKGTTFTIYLPLTHAQPKATAIESRGETTRGAGERVLLVEDEGALRELCATVLSRLGYRVGSAASGAEALRLVGEQGFEPDLVLTDVVMPEMSGVELAKRLQRDRPGLKVLYMSGYPDEAIAPHGVLGPGICLLQKPFSEEGLAVKVWETLGRREPPTPPARRVLMIDDDEQFLELVGHFLGKRGHVLASANSAAAARAALAGQSFDVLLVDLNIPGTSAEAILREIRAAGHTAPAVVFTGDVASADMTALRPLGVVCLLEKSSDPGPLLQAIDTAHAPGGNFGPMNPEEKRLPH